MKNRAHQGGSCSVRTEYVRSEQNPRRLASPRAAQVHVGESGVPVALAGAAVDSVREDWVVEDRWWTGRPVRRRYFELVLQDGRNAVVFHELSGGGWFIQRG